MKLKNYSFIFIVVTLALFCGCATTPPPLTYLATEKPKEAVVLKEQKELKKEFSRGGFYFANNNFRPAADVRSYIEQAEKEADTKILKNADIQLNVPFAFDILFFGYNKGTDFLTIKK